MTEPSPRRAETGNPIVEAGRAGPTTAERAAGPDHTTVSAHHDDVLAEGVFDPWVWLGVYEEALQKIVRAVNDYHRDVAIEAAGHVLRFGRAARAEHRLIEGSSA